MIDFFDNYIIAITGPSGSGKTTLGNNLIKEFEIAIPCHCTTRLRRSDDVEGFYRYLTHEEYSYFLDNDQFLISSGDGPFVKKECGNFYGVLISDCIDAIKSFNTIILFVSYKDLYQLINLQQLGFNIDIVNLTFHDIKKSVRERLIGNISRNHSESDIESRIINAIKDQETYGELLEEVSSTKVYTDILNEKETYEKVCSDLQLERKKLVRKRIIY